MKSTRVMRESGAVSLFAVIFAMLLITVVTVGFIRLMVNDQQQASNDDLSQSALDSAQAGVEDAKRALLRYREVCKTDTTACDSIRTQLSSASCNAALRDVVPTTGPDVNGNYSEVKIQQTLTDGADALDQAYTCVTVAMDTSDYTGEAVANTSTLVPLFSNDVYDRVTVEWFTLRDMSSGTTALSIPSSNQTFRADWPANRPPVLRAQLMQFGSSFTLEQFDARVTGATTQSNANTVFLYPHTSGAAQPINLAGSADIRTSDPAVESPADGAGVTPYPVTCQTSLANGGYACSATILLPQPIGGGDRTAFLRLTPFYNATRFKLTLANGASTAFFDSVQPAVDSTGRANDLYRRIVSRVSMYDTTFPYPEAAVNLTGNFCKDFSVTETLYQDASPACVP